MENRKLRKYIFATIALIKKQAFDVKEKVGGFNKCDEYGGGLLIGYAHILESFRNYTVGCWIDRKDLGLADIDPDADLLGFKPEQEDSDLKDMVDPLTEKTVQLYISDLMTILKEEAIEEKEQVDHPENGIECHRGSLMAYYQVFSTMQDQALLFDIDQKACRLSIIDPDRDLLPSLLKEKQ